MKKIDQEDMLIVLSLLGLISGIIILHYLKIESFISGIAVICFITVIFYKFGNHYDNIKNNYDNIRKATK